MDDSSFVSNIDSLFDRFTRSGSPGISLGVYKNGECVVKRGYGLANIESNVPIKPGSVFNIGSESKQFTAFAIHLLKDRGKLWLDDHLIDHLPRFHSLGNLITVGHLLYHTSGLRDLIPLSVLSGWRAGDVTTFEDMVDLLSKQRDLNFEPGEEHDYSNSGYLLLAKIVEHLSGLSFSEFCSQEIFKPLDMTSTLVHDEHQMLISDRANSYYFDESHQRFLNAVLTDTVLGSTNVYSTVEDLAKWHENFYSGSVGGLELIHALHQPGKLNNGSELDYASGLIVGKQHRGYEYIEHGGGQAGYGCWTLRFPQPHISVILLCNQFLWELRNLAFKVADEVLPPGAVKDEGKGADESIRSASGKVVLDSDEIRKKAGRYVNTDIGAIREVLVENDKLKLLDLDLAPISNSEFYFETFPTTRVVFSKAGEDVPSQLQIISEDSSNTYFRVETEENSEKDLIEYNGDYYSPELDQQWRVVARGNRLLISRWKYGTSVLSKLSTDIFRDDWSGFSDWPTQGMIAFYRDEAEAVIGLKVSCERLRGLRFFKQTDK